MEKYNVKNAYELSKRNIISKPQNDIFQFVKTLDQTAELEKNVKNTKYYADIILENSKKIIEFNGDYWHCNPNIYQPTYFHKVKNKFAKEIWDDDKKRKDILEQNGYDVLCIWENQYNNEHDSILIKIKDFLHE